MRLRVRVEIVFNLKIHTIFQEKRPPYDIMHCREGDLSPSRPGTTSGVTIPVSDLKSAVTGKTTLSGPESIHTG